jgi:chromosome segregation ATPase
MCAFLKLGRTLSGSTSDGKGGLFCLVLHFGKGNLGGPGCLEDRAHNIEMELNRTIQHTDEVHKTITKGERRVKELLFQQEENKKNQDRITDLVDKLQQKIKSYKKQIEEAEEIAAINLAKFRKAQQDFEEAEERSKICEANISKYRSARGASATPGPM